MESMDPPTEEAPRLYMQAFPPEFRPNVPQRSTPIDGDSVRVGGSERLHARRAGPETRPAEAPKSIVAARLFANVGEGFRARRKERPGNVSEGIPNRTCRELREPTHPNYEIQRGCTPCARLPVGRSGGCARTSLAFQEQEAPVELHCIQAEGADLVPSGVVLVAKRPIPSSRERGPPLS